MKLFDIFKGTEGTFSKRLLMTLLTGVAVPLMSKYDIPQEVIGWVVGLVTVFVGGQSVSDAAKNFSKKPAGNGNGS